MQALREYLQTTKTTQQQFADRLGVSQPTVSDWLNGVHMPTTPMLIRISSETGISTDKLLLDSKAA